MARISWCYISEKEESQGKDSLMQQLAAQWFEEHLWLLMQLRQGIQAQPVVEGRAFSAGSVFAAWVCGPPWCLRHWECDGEHGRPAMGARAGQWHPAPHGEGEDGTWKARFLPSFGEEGGGSQGST